MVGHILRRIRVKLWVLLLAACQAGASRPPETCPCSEKQRQGERNPDQGEPAPETPAEQESSAVASPATQAELAQKFARTRPITTLKGEASYYGDKFAGRRTANGERYNPQAFTAAHRHLPFGTVLRVVRVDTGSSVYVRINDRGPFGARRRILDVSRAAAERLGMLRAGVVPVRVEVVKRGS